MIGVAGFLLLLGMAPLAQGTMSLLRARLNGRPGPSPIQPYRNLRKLFAKEAIVSCGSSSAVLAAPAVAIGTAVTVAILVARPFGVVGAGIDAIAIAMTLALGRFVLVLAALDTRSAFEGMAASREMTFAALTESPLILALVSVALGVAIIPGILAASALLLVCLFETARIPVDNQETHYELTMIHEGLILEYSGWQLAMLQLAAYIRQLALFVLIAMLLPGGNIVGFGWVAVLVIGVPIVERMLAKMRLFEVPALFVAATVLAFTGIIVHVARLGA